MIIIKNKLEILSSIISALLTGTLFAFMQFMLIYMLFFDDAYYEIPFIVRLIIIIVIEGSSIAFTIESLKSELKSMHLRKLMKEILEEEK